MNLELFTKKGGRYGEPRITITTAYQIGLNPSCLDRYFRGKKYALLYGDRDKKIIGIKPIEKSEPNAFKISYTTSKTSGSISGHSFLKYLDIDFSKSKRFIPEWDNNMLIIKAG